MKEIIRSLDRWMCYAYIRVGLIMPVLFEAVLLYASIRDHGVLYEGKGTTIMLSHLVLILLLISVAIQLYVHIYLVKGTSEKIVRKPYRIEIGIHDKDEIFKLLNSKLQLKKVEEDCWYAEETIIKIGWIFGVHGMRLFVFLFEENSQNNDLEIADQYVNKVNRMTNFKSAPRYRTSVYSERVQVCIYDKVPEAVLETAQDNVERDNTETDSLTNFFIDLSEGVLYIPFLCSQSSVYAMYRQYRLTIKRVGEYLDLL